MDFGTLGRYLSYGLPGIGTTKLVGDIISGTDVIPGISKQGVFNAATGTTQGGSKPFSSVNYNPMSGPTGTAKNAEGDGGAYTGSGQYTLGSSATGAGAPTAADERAYYDDQINALNQLLGITDTQKNTGLTRLNESFAQQQARLNEQKDKTMQGYDQQSLTNSQDKQRGVENVDQFANNSYNSLQRLLQGGNAGNSSVGRELMPYLVSKAAGTRRQGVFDTAGKNEQSIVSARGDAQDQYQYSAEDLGNQRKNQEQSFLEGILNKQNDLTSQRRALEIQKAQANGSGYEAARAAGQASQGSINDRMAQLNALFGQYAPTFTTRAVNTKTPELGKFTVDPGQIKADSNLPAESSYYLSQLKKKQEGLV